MQEDELDKFVGEIVTTKKLPGMNEDVRKYLVSDLRDRLLDQINRALIDALPEDKIEEFSNLLDNESVNDDQVQQFIIQSGVDVKRVTARTMLLFRDLYLQTPKEREELAKAQEA